MGCLWLESICEGTVKKGNMKTHEIVWRKGWPLVGDCKNCNEEMRTNHLVQECGVSLWNRRMIKRIIIHEQENGRYEAVRFHEPGMSIVGRGATWKEALGDLLLNCTFQGIEAMEMVPYVMHVDGKPFIFRSER